MGEDTVGACGEAFAMSDVCLYVSVCVCRGVSTRAVPSEVFAVYTRTDGRVVGTHAQRETNMQSHVHGASLCIRTCETNYRPL